MDVQSVFSWNPWAPKVARKCESKHCVSGGRSVGVRHVITKFSRMGSLPHFLTHGAPQACFARQSSAINQQETGKSSVEMRPGTVGSLAILCY